VPPLRVSTPEFQSEFDLSVSCCANAVTCIKNNIRRTLSSVARVFKKLEGNLKWIFLLSVKIGKRSLSFLLTVSYFRLKDNPFDFKTFLNLGIELGPMPCNSKSCATVYFESCSGVLIPVFSSALLAGATTPEKLSSGFFIFSQMGQTGQSLLL